MKVTSANEPSGGPFFVEGSLHLVVVQEWVARTRGETPTEGQVTADLKGGASLTERVSLQLGISNLMGIHSVNHLNAKNPFTGPQLPEPSRVFFADLVVSL